MPTGFEDWNETAGPCAELLPPHAGSHNISPPEAAAVKEGKVRRARRQAQEQTADDGSLFSLRKDQIRAFFDGVAEERDSWIARNRFYYEEDWRYMRFLIPEGLRILEVGCGTGALLAALKPSSGVGIDLSPKMVEIASQSYPRFEFHVGDIEDSRTLPRLDGPFDAIIFSDTIGSLQDIIVALSNVRPLCGPGSRIVIAYYSHLWEPILRIARWLGVMMPRPEQNWLSTRDTMGFLDIAGFEAVKCDWRQLLPKRWFGLGTFVSRYVAPLPGIRRLALRNYVVARPFMDRNLGQPSASVVIPCRNEKGNIEAAIRRLPQFCDDLEILFVEGNSTDGTYEECLRVQNVHSDLDIKVLKQDGRGKADAVRKGLARARGEIFLILDADLTVAPEDLPKFYAAIASGKGDLINGTRFVYPMESGAMPLLNNVANRAFARFFSYLLNHRVTDTLCGTKALRADDYRRIANDRERFGDTDPFGDFELLIGGARINLKFVEIPVSYAARRYGSPQISRFRDGYRLARLSLLAYRKMKAF